MSENPITLDELLDRHGWHLVTYSVRYGGPAVGVLIGFDIDTLAAIADHMTGGDSDWYRAGWLPGSVPWFPAAEGDTFQEALELALAKVNTLTREQWFEHAVYEASSVSTKYAAMLETFDETKWFSLNPTPWLDVKEDEEDEEELLADANAPSTVSAEEPRHIAPPVVIRVISHEEFIRQVIDRSRT